MFWRIKRSPRPSVAFAHVPCPRQLLPPFTSSHLAIGPFTMSHTAAGFVVAWIACR
jgi:hypothetical protein